MQVDITGNGMEVTPALKTFTEEKISKLTHHSHQIIRIKVSFSVEKLVNTAKISLHIPGSELNASHESENLWKAIDGATDKMDRLLQKAKDK